MNLFTDDMRRNPFPIYDQLRRARPVFRTEGLGHEMWMLLSYGDVKRALTDHESFGSNVAPTRGFRFEWLLFVDPPRHTQLRAIVSKAFTPRSIAALEPRIGQIARTLVDDVLARGETDLTADFATPLPLMVIAEMVGVPTADWPHLRRWSEAIINLGSTIVGTPEAAQAASDAFNGADAEMTDYVTRLIAERRAAPKDDLLTRLAEAQVDGARLNDEEIVRFVQLLLAAGTETTTNLVDNAILCFLEHPAELARLRAAPGLLPSAIEEVLRYRSPAQVMFRATRRDVEVGGQTIPAGKFVMTVIGSANRDPAVFRDPDRLDVGRDPNPHLAFGHGIHFCLGAPLSRLEGRVALAELLSRVAHFEPATSAVWQPRQAFHIHGPVSLPLRVRAA